MAARPTSWLSRPGLLRTFLSQVRLALRLVREPHVWWLTKAVPLLTVVYIVSPLDFIPDVLPIIGQLDDLAVLLIAIEIFVRLCPAPAAEFHRAAIAQGRPYSPMRPTDDFIDVQWRHE